MKQVVIISIICFLALDAMSQTIIDDSVYYNPSGNLNKTSQELFKAISQGESNDTIAEKYYKLAIELIKTSNYSKAEFYLQKAIEYASKSKSNKRLPDYYRELARIQENQKKRKVAGDNYENAYQYSNENTQAQINLNDANRMRSSTNPYDELEFLNQNNAILSNSNSYSNEKFQNYNQIADINLSLNQTDEALKNYSNALNEVDDQSNEALKIKSDIANLMVQTKNYDEALYLQKEIVEQSNKISEVEVQVQQMRQLSDIYFSQNITQEGLQVLKDAYTLAIKKGSVSEARKSLIALISHYKKDKNNEEIISLYEDFITNLDSLILKDQSLIDVKLFELTEQKIRELEKERVVKNKIIEQKNHNNLLLFLLVIMLIGLILITVASWLSVKKKNRMIALQSLRREMNPHFIFNSLNSVNQFIASNNELEANKYLSSYSRLMRNMMENSNKDFIPLSLEIEQLKKYLELEKMRFPDKFDYRINIDEEIDTDIVKVPNMIIQPNLENAIWHGLRYRDSIGFLNVSFSIIGKHVLLEIEDNGIGIEQSKMLKTHHQNMHKSRGLKNIQERINLLNKIHKSGIKFEVIDKDNGKGVKVKIIWKNN
ncbi:MAG: histidine kinase [Bacteroidales bacterium]|nr:histidine kinase [Bacteroidales bacterium]